MAYGVWFSILPTIRDQDKRYCFLLIMRLLSPEVVGAAHLETIYSQVGIGQHDAMFYRLA